MHIGDINNNSVENLKFAYRSQILHQTYKRGRRKIGKPTQNKFSFNGVQYKKLSDLAKRYKINPKLLYRRIANGWSLDETVSIPYERKERILNKRLYKYKGKLMSVEQLSQISEINRKNIYKRLNRGWSVEEAVEIPLAERRKNNNE